MSYLVDFLDCFEEHIEDYEILLYVLSLLPDSFQYIFALNLLKYRGCLIDGDIHTGEKTQGFIELDGKCIFLTTDDEKYILLELPPAFEI